MSQINDIPHVIQVSVAPVFLLTSVAGALSVFTTRLASWTAHASWTASASRRGMKRSWIACTTTSPSCRTAPGW